MPKYNYIFDNNDEDIIDVNNGHIFKEIKHDGSSFLIEIDTKKVEDNFKNLSSSEVIELVVKSIFRLSSWEVSTVGIATCKNFLSNSNFTSSTICRVCGKEKWTHE